MSTHVHAPLRQIPLGFTPELYPEGTHICYLYSDEEERKRFISTYLSSGIDAREAVTYVADTGFEMLDHAIEGLGIAPPQEQDQFMVATAMETYFPSGRFEPEKMLDHIRDMYASVPADCAGARATAEMTWALHDIPGVEHLIEYEAQINEVLKTHPMTTLCQYDTRKFSGAMIYELLNVHPIMIVHGQIMRNPFYVPPPPIRGGKTGTRDDRQ
ncbi:MAG: hypothetical protein JWQ01_3038 [Massilia sp.]|jgi:hypothetical protein|nr:hypothetical protein [Massilia sp.]